MTQVSLVFDDGFVASCHRIAEIFEARAARATFAVLVDHDGFMPDFPKGDFALWNELQERGHVIHPHGADHSDLSKLPIVEARAKIDSCLDSFTKHLAGFDPSRVVYHLTYNRSTSDVDAYLLSKVAAIRTTGPEGAVGSGFNNAADFQRRTLTCAWHGPDHCDEHLLTTIERADAEQPALLLYMLHGIDDEGWGPIRAHALETALDRILASPNLELNDLSNLAFLEV